MNYTIAKNDQFNSLEITFSGKPSEAVRNALKALHFRWNGKRGLWYGFADCDAVVAAIEGKDSTEAQKRTTAPKKAQKSKSEPQNHIKIYWNGIKIDGGKMVRCFYSINNNAKIDGDCVSISARDYDHLPADLLPVKNDTDIYTDYFDSDRATLTPEHPLYKYFRFAAVKSKIHDLKRHIEYNEKELANRERWPGRHEYIRQELEKSKKELSDLERIEDPGQPTAEDLAQIDRQRQEAENARRAAEHEEELKRREKALCQRVNGQRLIRAEMEAHPIDARQPVVLIHWSEHPAFYEYADDSLLLSLTAAENILRTLDEECKDELGYFKTKFTITGGEFEGDPIDYTGRYDLGDNEGGLIQHIRNFGEWNRTHNIYGHEIENPEESTATTRFADFLGSLVA